MHFVWNKNWWKNSGTSTFVIAVDELKPQTSSFAILTCFLTLREDWFQCNIFHREYEKVMQHVTSAIRKVWSYYFNSCYRYSMLVVAQVRQTLDANRFCARPMHEWLDANSRPFATVRPLSLEGWLILPSGPSKCKCQLFPMKSVIQQSRQNTKYSILIAWKIAFKRRPFWFHI